jgi:hypothetical protein
MQVWGTLQFLGLEGQHEFSVVADVYCEVASINPSLIGNTPLARSHNTLHQTVRTAGGMWKLWAGCGLNPYKALCVRARVSIAVGSSMHRRMSTYAAMYTEMQEQTGEVRCCSD